MPKIYIRVFTEQDTGVFNYWYTKSYSIIMSVQIYEPKQS